MVDQLGRCVYGLNNNYPTGLSQNEGSVAWQSYGEIGNVEWPEFAGEDPNWGFVQIDAEFAGDTMVMNVGGVEYKYDDSTGQITPVLQEYQP